MGCRSLDPLRTKSSLATSVTAGRTTTLGEQPSDFLGLPLPLLTTTGAVPQTFALDDPSSILVESELACGVLGSMSGLRRSDWEFPHTESLALPSFANFAKVRKLLTSDKKIIIMAK